MKSIFSFFLSVIFHGIIFAQFNISKTDVLCNGTCDGTGQVLPTGNYRYSWTTGDTTESVNSLCAGVYDCTVSDSLGTPLDTLAVTILQPSQLSLSLSATATCFGESAGSIDLVVSGSTPPYLYSWSNGAITEDITNLPDGNYSVTVSDANNCTTFSSGTVNANPLLTVSISPATVTICSGMITVLTASGGVSYIWSNAASTASITVSPATTTTYTVTITDANGCTASDSRTVTVQPSPTAAISNPGYICIGQNTTLVASGAGAGGSYEWSTGSTNASINVAPIATTTYTVTVTNSNGCTASATRTVTVNQAPNASISPATANICIGVSIILTASGAGTGGYYDWNTGGSTANLTVSPTVTTTYTITVTNSGGCTASTSRTVNVNPSPIASISPATANICLGTSIILTATGGVTYSWSTGAVGTAITVSPSTTTTYSVTISNSNGCTAAASRTVNVMPNITASITPGSTSICTGASQMLIASGGTIYSWSTGAASPSITVSPTSTTTYTVTVTDGGTCSATASRTVTVLQLITANAQSINASGCGSCNGSSQIIASGGTPPYLYQWSNGASDSVINNLCAGIYSFSVTDGSSCSATGTTVINSDTSFSLSLLSSGADCNTHIDTITLTISNGNPPFDISWADGSDDLNQTDSVIVHYYSSPGIYQVVVTDSLNCFRIVTDTVQSTGISLTLEQTVQPICSASNGKIKVAGSNGTLPYSYSWNNGAIADSIENSPAGNYSVIVTDNSGCTATETYVLTPNNLIVNITPVQMVQPICSASNGKIKVSVTGGIGSPYTYNWNNGATADSIQNIIAGYYTVTATDGNGCSAAATYSLQQNTNNFSAYATSTGANCSTGTPGTATIYTSNGQPPYSYQWNTNPVQTTQTATGLSAGSYLYTVSDANGCWAPGSINVQSSNYQYYVYVYGSSPNCSNNGTLTATVGGGHPPYLYLWNTNPPQTTQTAGGLGAGSYRVTVTDAIGCQKIGTYTLQTTCYNVVTGIVYNDANGNCIFDVGETPRNGISVRATNGNYNYYDYTNTSGQFSISIHDSGTFSLNVYLNSGQCGNLSLCGNPDISVTFASLGDTLSNNIGLAASPGYDLGLHPGWNRANPGFQKEYWILYYNQSPAPFTVPAVITFVYDPALIFQSVSIPYTTHDTATHTLTWVVNNIPYPSWNWGLEPHIYFTVPASLPLTYQLHTTFSIEPTVDDCDLSDNSLSFIESVTGSRDPNEKQVLPAGDITEDISVLTYTIHFQNNGTDTTHFVIVTDTLPPTVDPASVKTVAASHDYSEFKLEGEGILTWIFNPIFLPDSATDEAGSKGFVSFVVKKNQKMEIGTEIKNKASIFFDYNEPIITNIVTSTLVEPVYIVENEEAKISVNAFPNPFSDATTIVVTGLDGTFDFSLFDAAGKEWRTINSMKANRFELKRNGLAAGIYFYRITTDGKNRANGKLVIK